MIFNPTHPGEVLRDCLSEMTVAEAAKRLGVTRAHLSRILNGRAGVSAAMSLRLSAALGTSPEFWLNMQMRYDLSQKAKQPKIRPFPHVTKKTESALALSGIPLEINVHSAHQGRGESNSGKSVRNTV